MIFKNVLILLILSFASNAIAQIDYDLVESSSRSLFLDNVLLVKGQSENATPVDILIIDGKIKSIGELEAPYNAEILKADSLYAYPGFIAGLSHAGIKKSEDKNDGAKPRFRGFPSNGLAGITPEQKATDIFDPKESSIDKYRKAGFSLVNTAPQGKMLPGRAAIFSLADGTRKDAIVKDISGLYATLKSAKGVYPGTIIGLMAKWRELYHNASYASAYHKKYTLDPTIGPRSKYDEATEAMIAVADNELVVYFKAENTKDIYRVLDLQKELGFKLVLSEIEQGAEMISKIKTQTVGILLSLDLPEELKISEEDVEDLSEEEKAFTERRKKSYESYLAQAAEFESAGIEFGFSFVNTKPSDIKKNLIRVHQAGLSETALLKALSSYPAQLLGIESIAGEPWIGKMANLVVTDKPFLEEDSRILYNIIEGNKFEYKKDEKSKVTNGDLAALTGNWKFTIEIQGEIKEGHMVIEGEDDLSITVYREDDETPMEASNIILEGSKLQFDFQTQNEGQNMDLEMKIEFDGSNFEGNVVSDFGLMPIEGSKKGPSN